MMRLLFWLFGKAIRRHIAQDRPRGMAGLERAFSGLDGKDYFGWPDVGQMPPVRQKHIERCLAIANAGISEKTLEELCDLADAANMDAMKAESAKDRAKAHSRIAFVLGEIRNRPKNVIPEDVYYDLAAHRADVVLQCLDHGHRRLTVEVHAKDIVACLSEGAGCGRAEAAGCSEN
mgnify:CR=1 FL=1